MQASKNSPFYQTVPSTACVNNRHFIYACNEPYEAKCLMKLWCNEQASLNLYSNQRNPTAVYDMVVYGVCCTKCVSECMVAGKIVWMHASGSRTHQLCGMHAAVGVADLNSRRGWGVMGAAARAKCGVEVVGAGGHRGLWQPHWALRTMGAQEAIQYSWPAAKTYLNGSTWACGGGIKFTNSHHQFPICDRKAQQSRHIVSAISAHFNDFLNVCLNYNLKAYTRTLWVQSGIDFAWSGPIPCLGFGRERAHLVHFLEHPFIQ